MPRFYFHLSDGSRVVRDPEGSELPGLDEARNEAKADCRGYVISEMQAGRGFPMWAAVDICDEEGRTLMVEWARGFLPTNPFSSPPPP